MTDDTHINTDKESVTDGGEITEDKLIELALEYCDEALRTIGVVGIESARCPGEKIRHLPTEATGSHIPRSLVGGRVLTDVSDFNDEDAPVASHDDVQYMSIRETTGYAAIHSSATLALGWKTLPTGREIRLAEYLYEINEEDLRRSGQPLFEDSVSEEIVSRILPDDTSSDDRDLWVPVEQTSISNMEAIKQCVARITTIDDDTQLVPLSYRDGSKSEEGPFSEWSFRVREHALAVESYSETRGSYEDCVFWFDSDNDEWVEVDGRVDGVGYVDTAFEHSPMDASSDLVNETLSDTVELIDISTRVWTIPEIPNPVNILNLEQSTPYTPNSSGKSVRQMEGSDWEVVARHLQNRGGVPKTRAKVVALVDAGYTHSEVAEMLDIQDRSNVGTHLRRYRKNRNEAEWVAENAPEL